MPDAAPDAYAWDVIAQVADLLRGPADDGPEPVRAAFALVEDALADRAAEVVSDLVQGPA